MKKVAGYIRNGISKKEREQERKQIEAYCTANDMIVVEWLGDGLEGFGSVAYGNWIGHRKIQAVVAATPEAVTDSVYEFYAYRCKLQMRGCNLIVTQWKDYAGYGLYQKIFEEFTKTLCRLEFDHDPVRNSQKRIRKARKGEYIGGQAPMGYRVEDGRLVVNPEEVPVVMFIMEEKHRGGTKLGTVEKLNAEGYRTRNGKPFVISTVQSIWNNEKFYQGYYKYKDLDEWVKGQHEAILKE